MRPVAGAGALPSANEASSEKSALSAANKFLRGQTNNDDSGDCTLFIFTMASYFTMASSCTVGMAQLILILGAQYLDIVGTIVRMYGIVLCGVAILAELEITEAIRSSAMLQNWVARGIFYIFLGLLALNNSNYNENLDSSAQTYVTAASLSLVTMGCIYSFMGLLCLKRLKDDRMAKYIQLLSHREIQEARGNRA